MHFITLHQAGQYSPVQYTAMSNNDINLSVNSENSKIRKASSVYRTVSLPNWKKRESRSVFFFFFIRIINSRLLLFVKVN
jgi:hypothetical protein